MDSQDRSLPRPTETGTGPGRDAVPSSIPEADLAAPPVRPAERHVSFAYEAGSGGGKPVISGLNLHIRPGEKVGLVGRSGAGKSTLVNLLLRFPL